MRQVKAIGLVGLVMMTSACVIEATSPEQLQCGGAQGGSSSRRCVDGVWELFDAGKMPADLPDLQEEMGPPDMELDLDLDLPDMSDLPDMTPVCDDATVAALCQGVACGAPDALSAMCPDKSCPDTCAAGTTCVGTSCEACLENDQLDAAQTEALCAQLQQEELTANGFSSTLSCAQEISPAADRLCDPSLALDCTGICPDTWSCTAGRCCLSQDELCQQVSVAQACTSPSQVTTCEGANGTVATLCQEKCIYNNTFGTPTSSMTPRDAIAAHPAGVTENAFSGFSVVYWLRPDGSFFNLASGKWVPALAQNSGDARLFDMTKMPIMSASSPAMSKVEGGINFNPFVDLNGGFIEFDRPTAFTDDVTVVMVVRTNPGDAVDPPDDEMNSWWYREPALLSGEQNGGDDFGLTMRQGALRWSKTPDDKTVFSSPERFDDGEWHIVVVSRQNKPGDSNDTYLFVDGDEIAVGNTDESHYANPLVRIGLQPDPHSDAGRWTGDVAEVLLLTGYVNSNSSAKKALESYMALKYGVTLPREYVLPYMDRSYDLRGYEREVIGLMCRDSGLAMGQTGGRQVSDELVLELRYGSTYDGLVDCAPSSNFALLMSHDGAALSEVQPFTFTRPGEEVMLERVARQWKIQMLKNGDLPLFTLTFKDSTLLDTFAADMVVLWQEGSLDKMQAIPLTRTLQGDVSVLVRNVADPADTSKKIFDVTKPIFMTLARFPQ